ncbi:MAG: SDR family NAD(P)-dependent oxidoreductase, partial [Burkholderiales bacterium]|nr:SDR family NAD(P)-dependent oxidoreductase [Burkholderiales bacterium]
MDIKQTQQHAMKPTKHTVLITGGATGIGYAIARKFHAAGNRVILAGRSEKSLIQACNQMSGAEFSVSDISKPEDRDSLLQQFPDVNILVNNAGIQINTSILDSTPAQMEYELNINFLAAALLCRAYLPRMVQQTDAAIINISSGLAIVPKENASMYCASKA